MDQCNIWEEGKISLFNKMIKYKIWLRLKGCIQKIVSNILPNFVKGPYKSWLKFCPFFMAESEQNEAKGQSMLKKAFF